MRLFEGTEFDRPPRCERCGELEEECACPPLPPVPPVWADPQSQLAKVVVEKRKKGKMVTVIRGLAAVDNDLPELLSRIKNHCGAGGTIKGDTLEVQGRHIERVRSLLLEIGYRIKG